MQLQQAIQPGKTELLERYAVYTDLQRPLPAQIGQADSQKVLFEGSHLAPAAYPVKKQTTKVRPEAVQQQYYAGRLDHQGTSFSVLARQKLLLPRMGPWSIVQPHFAPNKHMETH